MSTSGVPRGHSYVTRCKGGNLARQPFFPTYSGKSTEIAAWLIDDLPKLAECVGRIAINWSGVEIELALLLGSMLGVENPASVAVFLSLRNHRAQRDALNAAAEKTLAPDIALFFDAILKIHKRLDGQRNDVIHCIWGTSESTPDGIVWSSLQDHANMLITDYHAAARVPGYDRAKSIEKSLAVYRYTDLETLNRDIRDLATAVRHLHAFLRYMGQSAGDNALAVLQANRLVKEVLS